MLFTVATETLKIIDPNYYLSFEVVYEAVIG